MSQPNIGEKKVPGSNNIKKHKPKKEYSLRSKHNTKTATVSEISHSGEPAQHTLNEERLLSDQNKNPSVFPNPKHPNLTANGRNEYYHVDSQYGRYGYDHQADNQYNGNEYYLADSQYDRYGYDHQTDNQYDGNEYDHVDSRYGRYGYGHQADNQYVNGYDHADYQCSGNERNHSTDDQYGGCTSNQADNEGYRASRRIGSNKRHHFYSNDSCIYSKYVWGNDQNNTDTQQLKKNQFIGRGVMNVRYAGVIH